MYSAVKNGIGQDEVAMIARNRSLIPGPTIPHAADELPSIQPELVTDHHVFSPATSLCLYPTACVS